MIAVTIAVGEQYRRMAYLAVASIRRHLGVDVEMITDTGDVNPAHYKLRLLDRYPGQTVVYFDADARVLQHWDLSQFDDLAFPVAVQDWSSAARDADCRHYGIDASRYVATGFWIANWRHRAVWAAAAELAASPDYTTQFKYEQTALNVALQRSRTPVTLLDHRHWWIANAAHRAPPDTLTVALGGELDGYDRQFYDAAIRRAEAR